MRPGVQVRAAVPEDLADLVTLCVAAREESSLGADDDTAAEVLHDQLSTLLASAGGRILVGVLDERLAGFLFGRVVEPSPFSQEVSLQVESLYVGAGDRRHGLGHAMLAGALAVAEEAGATQVYATHLPGARGVQRFFVRMGFAPAAAHRVVAIQTLRRRLAGDPVTARSRHRSPARGLEDLIARRRQVRKEIQTGPVDLRGVSAALDAEAESDAEAGAPADQPAGRSSISRQVKRAVASRREPESSTTIS